MTKRLNAILRDLRQIETDCSTDVRYAVPEIGEPLGDAVEAVWRAILEVRAREKNVQAYPGGTVAGVPRFNTENIAYVEASNRRKR